MANLLKHNAASVAAMDIVTSAAKAGTYEIRKWDGAPGQPGSCVNVLCCYSRVSQASSATQTVTSAPTRHGAENGHQVSQVAVCNFVVAAVSVLAVSGFGAPVNSW